MSNAGRRACQICSFLGLLEQESIIQLRRCATVFTASAQTTTSFSSRAERFVTDGSHFSFTPRLRTRGPAGLRAASAARAAREAPLPGSNWPGMGGSPGGSLQRSSSRPQTPQSRPETPKTPRSSSGMADSRRSSKQSSSGNDLIAVADRSSVLRVSSHSRPEVLDSRPPSPPNSEVLDSRPPSPPSAPLCSEVLDSRPPPPQNSGGVPVFRKPPRLPFVPLRCSSELPPSTRDLIGQAQLCF